LKSVLSGTQGLQVNGFEGLYSPGTLPTGTISKAQRIGNLSDEVTFGTALRQLYPSLKWLITTPRRCSFLHDHCIETEQHGISQALTEEWSSRLYEPGTLLDPF